MLFEGFDELDVDVAGTTIHLVRGGAGPPLLLLHGYPQTHVCWHKIAPALARHFALVIPDLPGYGDSAKPELPPVEPAPANSPSYARYAKRRLAAEILALMRSLGFERFGVVGHDRGGRVAYRLALDQPSAIERIAVLDIIPTIETFERLDRAGGLATYHWYFLAQPYDLPERLIGSTADYYLDHKLAAWGVRPDAFPPEVRAEYQRCFRDPRTIYASCEDYRAGATIDCDHDLADRAAERRIEAPLLALWGEPGGAQRRWTPLPVWERWARDVRGRALDCGHFLQEELPDEVTADLLRFFG